MRGNESGADRLLRGLVGVILLVLAFVGGLTGAGKTVALVAGAILLVTGLIGFCPIYAIFGMSTGKK